MVYEEGYRDDDFKWKTDGRLFCFHYVFKKKKMKAFLGTYYLLYHKFIINKFSYLKLMDLLKVYFWLKYFKSFGYDI